MVEASNIRLENVSKTYVTGKTPRDATTVEALHDVSLSIQDGEFVALVGLSGCGKSTLLKIIAGLIPQDAGTVTIAGKEPRAGRTDVGIMLQTPALLPWRTVLQNVMLPFAMFHEDLNEGAKRAQSVLKMVDLRDFRDAYPRQLSGGMAQRAALARLLAYDPRVQLLDEPFGALDEFTRERLNLELARIHEVERRTAVLVTHSVQEAVLLADRIIVLTPRPGTVAGEVTVDLPHPREAEMLEDPGFIDAMRETRRLLGLERDRTPR